MKLNTLVSALALLGVVSLPAFAADNTNAAAQQAINNNQANASFNPSSIVPNWFQYFTLSGEFNVDTSMQDRVLNTYTTSTRTDVNTFFAGHSSQVALNTAQLYLDGNVGDWVQVHTALDYDNNFNTGANTASLFFSEATLQVSNFARSPFYFRAGQQFLNFGNYTQDSIVVPMTQMLEQANAPALVAGVLSKSGLNFDLYMFSGPTSAATQVSNPEINGWGADLGFARQMAMLSYNLHLGFLNNMANLTYANLVSNTYSKSVPGVSAHADVSSGPLSLVLDYVGATTNFATADIPSDTGARGAKPWAYGINLNYAFNVQNMTSKFGIGYEQSGDAANIYNSAALGGFWMPEYRMSVHYELNPVRNLVTALEYYHDTDYEHGSGGTGSNDNVGVFRVGLKF